MRSSLNLFKAVPITGGSSATKEQFSSVNEKFVQSGFVFSPEVLAEYTEEKLDKLVKEVNALYGKDGRELNKSFHKSFSKVRDASMHELWLEQSLHYLTTYGFEQLGFFSHGSVYVPVEDLDIPEIEEGFKLTVIRGLTKDELKDELLDFLQSGIAFKDATIKDVLDVATFVGITQREAQEVKNKEVRIALYDYFGYVPSNNAEFLRYLVYRITGMTQIVKNTATIEAIKSNFTITHEGMLVKYVQSYGEDELAKLFYRYKPVFLALRKTTNAKKLVNSIRRSAVKNHQPMREDILNSLTKKIKRGEVITRDAFAEALDNVNTFRKARLIVLKTTKVYCTVYVMVSRMLPSLRTPISLSPRQLMTMLLNQSSRTLPLTLTARHSSSLQVWFTPYLRLKSSLSATFQVVLIAK
jgi:hypothetical protein